MDRAPGVDAADRALVVATQAGLPVVERPFAELARRTGMNEAEVIARMQRMQDAGIIRRIAAVPNHYLMGYRANGMSVWDVDDAAVATLGPAVGALDFVTHCYRRPRHLPLWPYNLFAMVHGVSREAVEAKVDRIAALLGPACRDRDLLYSTRILKKTGMRLKPE